MNKKLIISIAIFFSLIFTSFLWFLTGKFNSSWTLPFKAALASLFQGEKETELNKLEKIITSLEDELEAERNLRNDLESKYNSQIEEVIKKIDSLSEKIEIVVEKTTEIEIAYQNKLTEDNLLEKGQIDSVEETKKTGKKEQFVLCDLNQALEPKQDSVIFNEISWMGTVDSSNNEWIELKNISAPSME